MLKLSIFFIFFIIACTAQEYEEYRPEPKNFGVNRFKAELDTTAAPIAILKQINKHNEDGSYTYGYEGADGSFKIETKAANGEVKGKYGYFDGEKIRVVEYGANKFGFQPSGEGITVPPPNLVEEKEPIDYEDEPPRQNYAAKSKFSNQPRPQIQYAPSPVVEKRKPVAPQQQQYQPPLQQQQHYYDYEEEVVSTPQPVPAPRPKYSLPTQQAAPRPQFENAAPIDIVYADNRQAPKSQFQIFEDRQPAQFPKQEPTPQFQSATRANDFSFFTPSNSRADSFSRPKSPTPQAPTYSQPSFAQDSFQQFPAPQPAQRPVFASKPTQSRSTSILDQLAKEYAIPQSSAPLHDISFGYSV